MTYNQNEENFKKVAVIMGSDSDFEVMKEAIKVLKQFEVPVESHVYSAHRTPEKVAAFTSKAKENGFGVIVVGAGAAAHLAGVIAAHTTLPIIGVPLNATSLAGVDALYATVQMPAGIPVATVAIGKAGAINAALLSISILSLSNPELMEALEAYRKNMKQKVDSKDQKLQQMIDSL